VETYTEYRSVNSVFLVKAIRYLDTEHFDIYRASRRKDVFLDPCGGGLRNPPPSPCES
jgi:hypothetical protein